MIRDALGWMLVHFLWQGSVVALGVWGVMRVMRGSAARYVAGCAGLALMMVGLVVTFGYECVRQGREPVVAAVAVAPIMKDSRLVTDAGAGEGVAERVVGNMPERVNMAGRGTTEGRSWDVARVEALVEGWLGYAEAVWGAGVVVLSLRMGASWMGVRRMRRQGRGLAGRWAEELARLRGLLGIGQRVEVMSSEVALVPLVIGWIKPVVLVPAGMAMSLSPGQVEALLAHELAHIRRHDYLVNLVQNVVETLCFYHPAVWWVSGQIRREREHCCDDVAAQVCGGSLGYARALAALEELRGVGSMGGLVVAANGGSLVSRIRRLVGMPVKEGGSWLGVVLAMLMAGVVGSLALAGGGAESAKAGGAATQPGTSRSGIAVKTEWEKKIWRIGESVPQVKALVDIENPTLYRNSGLMEKTFSHAPSAFAVEIDGTMFNDPTIYHTWPIGLQQPDACMLALDDQWRSGPFKTPQGYVTMGTPLNLAAGKHSVRVMFIGLGQDPAPTSEAVEIEVLPAERKLAEWKGQWGEAVKGVAVGMMMDRVVRQGEVPKMSVRIRNAGGAGETFEIHKRPMSFLVEIDGRVYEDIHVYPAWREPFGKGDEFEVALELNGNWESGRHTVEEERNGMKMGTYVPGVPLQQLTVGKHTVRVIFSELGKEIRPQSEPVEIEVQKVEGVGGAGGAAAAAGWGMVEGVERVTQPGTWKLDEGVTLEVVEVKDETQLVVHWSAEGDRPAMRKMVVLARGAAGDGAGRKFGMAWEKGSRRVWVVNDQEIESLDLSEPARILEDMNGRKNASFTFHPPMPEGVKKTLEVLFVIGRQPDAQGLLLPGGNTGGQIILSAETEQEWKVSGKVTNAAGDAVAGIPVEARWEYWPTVVLGSGKTDAQGRYALQFRLNMEGLAKYRDVFVEPRLDDFCDKDLAVGGEFTAVYRKDEKVDKPFSPRMVVLNGEAGQADFVLLPAPAVTGVLVDGAGKPMEKAYVALRAPGQRPGYSVASAVTDAQGEFRLACVPAGMKLELIAATEPLHEGHLEGVEFSLTGSHRIRLVGEVQEVAGMKVAMERVVPRLTSATMPADLRDSLSWGNPAKGASLVAAVALEPRKKEYAVGEVVHRWYYLLNAGKETVSFAAGHWQQDDMTQFEAVDGAGQPVKKKSMSFHGLTALLPAELKPGEYVRVPGPDVCIGPEQAKYPEGSNVGTILDVKSGEVVRVKGTLRLEDSRPARASDWTGPVVTGVLEFAVK